LSSQVEKYFIFNLDSTSQGFRYLFGDRSGCR